MSERKGVGPLYLVQAVATLRDDLCSASKQQYVVAFSSTLMAITEQCCVEVMLYYFVYYFKSFITFINSFNCRHGV